MNEGFNKEQRGNLKKKEFFYVKDFIRFKTEEQEKYKEILAKIKEYSFEKFTVTKTGYSTIITPDSGFLKLIDELNDHLNDKINLDKITLLITKEFINLIDFELGIPGILKGSSIGYKLYKLLVKSYGYISSDKNSSDEAKNLWWNLIIDDELYCIASRCFCAIISKRVSNSLLKEVLDKIKHNNWKETVDEIQFDDDTRAKIDELYGSFGNYRN